MKLYIVKVEEADARYRNSKHVHVFAENPADALEAAKTHPAAKKLWDEEIQRAIINGEIKESRVERKYPRYIGEVEYVEG